MSLHGGSNSSYLTQRGREEIRRAGHHVKRAPRDLSARAATQWNPQMPDHLPRIALATGDPAGIGPEVTLKPARDAGVNGICRPLLVGDPTVIRKHADAAGLKAELRIVSDVKQATWSAAAPEGL